jgi:hypothetical protein
MLVQFTYLAGLLVILVIAVVSVRSSGLWHTAAGRPRRPPRQKRRSRSRRIRGVVVGAGLVVLVATIAEAAMITRAVGHIRKGTQALSQAAAVLGNSPDQWTQQHISNAQILQGEAHDELTTGYSDMVGDPGLKLLEHLPWAGDQVHALLSASRLSVAAARGFGDLVDVARIVDSSRAATKPTGQRLLDLLAAAAPPWADAQSQLDPAMAGVQSDMGRPLVPPLRDLLAREVDGLRPLADEARVGAVVGKFAPAALGASAPQNYLVLLPNPSEIRPSGGFSGSIATTVMSAGAPTTIDVKNQEDFNPLMKARQPVPVALARYLKFYKNGLELGDAGWDPDFPTTARLSETMYVDATKKPVDGTISIDPYALAALLSVTGPVDVPPYGTFDSGNFFTKLNTIVNASTGPGAGKSALPPISRAVLNKVLTQPAGDWPKMLTVMRDQAEQRHIQAYFHEPALAAATAKVHFDGAMVANPGDYLMVADANVGATKGDAFAHKSMEVRTEVHPGQGVVRHEVLVHYDMPNATDDVDRALNPGDGSLRDYVRFFLPREAAVAGVTVVSGSGKRAEGGLDAISLAHERQSVGAFVRVPRGEKVDLTLVYEVPLTGNSGYGLYLQKESGVASLPTTLVVSYPGGVARRQTDLMADRQVQVSW